MCPPCQVTVGVFSTVFAGSIVYGVLSTLCLFTTHGVYALSLFLFSLFAFFALVLALMICPFSVPAEPCDQWEGVVVVEGSGTRKIERKITLTFCVDLHSAKVIREGDVRRRGSVFQMQYEEGLTQIQPRLALISNFGGTVDL
jgi:hypothetical protein